MQPEKMAYLLLWIAGCMTLAITTCSGLSLTDSEQSILERLLREPILPSIDQHALDKNEDVQVKWQVQLEKLIQIQQQVIDDGDGENKVSSYKNLLWTLNGNKHIKGTLALVESNGYPAEQHTVRTPDGYLLTAFRLPRPGRPVAFLMHGLLSSSADYVVLGRGRALAFALYEAGFDVWMGNARGSTPSRRHERLRPTQAKFWDFTWHEIGTVDLPALIDYVHDYTNQTAVHYVGHSQGTTAFFVLGSERPEYMSKIKTFTALAPVAYVRDIRSIPLRLMALAPNTLASILRLVGINEFLPNSRFISWLADTFCADTDITQPLCTNILFLLGGTDSQEMNATMIPDIVANTPAGASTKQLLHYGQLIRQRSLKFTQFDHGLLGNLLHYKSIHPPNYNLKNVNASTYLVYSYNDLLSVQSNIDELVRQLPNMAPDGLRKVSLDEFNHLDYIFGKDAKELVYNDVIAAMQKYEVSSKEK